MWYTAELIQEMLPAFRACAYVFPYTVMGFWGSQDWALRLTKGNSGACFQWYHHKTSSAVVSAS